MSKQEILQNSEETRTVPKLRKADHEFYNLREYFVSKKMLYKDEKFENSSTEGDTCIWARAGDMTNDPIFVEGEISMRTYRKGQMSSDPFAVVVNVLSNKVELWNLIVAEDQTFTENYAGMFLFRFWKFGQLVPTIVDDILPIHADTKDLMLTSVIVIDDTKIMWCPLLEKAYAKFLGGYKQLQNVKLPEVIADILGCSVHLYNLKTLRYRTLSALLRNAFEYNCVAVVEISNNNAPFGNDSCWTFIVVSIKSDEVEGKLDWFVTLHDPYSTKNPTLSEFFEATKSEVEVGDNNQVDSKVAKDYDSNFQITFEQLLEVFDKLYICHTRFPGLFANVGLQQKNWETQLIVGRWSHSRQTEYSKYNEPMLRIKISKPDVLSERGLCTLKVSLMQLHRPSFENGNVCDKIGLKVLALTGTETTGRLPTKALSLSEPVFKSDMYSEGEISLHFSLEPGQYLIVPERNREMTTSSKRYLMTLFSLEPIYILNSGGQKYGKGFLSTLELEIEAPQYVLVGNPIRISVKISVPPMTRYTITILLSFRRSASTDQHYSVIKARLEHIEVCHALKDKELSLNVYYHEYVKFPLMNEEFMAHCSAFIHESSTEVQSHRIITTIYPKLKMTMDRTLYTKKSSVMTAMLHNTLPITIRSAKFEIRCSSAPTVQSGLRRDVPPFSTMWIICSMMVLQPGCQQITTVFTSSLFNRSVTTQIQVMSSVSPADLCASESERTLLLGERPVIDVDYYLEKQVSCCKKHKSVKEFVDCHMLRWWYVNDTDVCDERESVDSHSLEDNVYCKPTRDHTPESELPTELVPEESQSTIT